MYIEDLRKYTKIKTDIKKSQDGQRLYPTWTKDDKVDVDMVDIGNQHVRYHKRRMCSVHRHRYRHGCVQELHS